ncbi:hypothetical protein ACOMHN_006890 [Nucella lapillus]
MSDREGEPQRQSVDNLLGARSELHIRPQLLLWGGPHHGALEESRPSPQALRPQDIDLHGLNHPAPGEGDQEEPSVDLHPPTEALVPSLAPYRPPTPLPGPHTSLEGFPPPLDLTIPILGIKQRLPLKLVPERRDGD